MYELITSVQNPKIKQAIKLKDAKERREKGLILVEGRKELSLALEAGIKIETLFYSPEFAGDDDDLLLLINKKVVFNTSSNVFEKMAYREKPDGFLAIARPKEVELEKIKLGKNPIVIVLDSVEKPGNIGAILRSADAAGADAVIVCDTKTDLFNPNVIRSSLGTIFTNQVAVTTSDNARRWLKKNNIKILATTPHAEKFYTKIEYKGGIGILIGAEHIGLSKRWIDEADEKIRIEMRGKIDSLNASVSLAVILFEALRQRDG